MDPNSTIKELFFLRNYLKSNIDIWVNTTRLGVVLPEFLYADKNAKLNLGLAMQIPIPIDVNWEGIRCTLSFNRKPFQCQLPWSSIFFIRALQGLPVGKDYLLFPSDAYVEEQEEPTLAPTGTDSGASGKSGTIFHPPQSHQTQTPKRASIPIPQGWGLINGGLSEQTTNNEKEPA